MNRVIIESPLAGDVEKNRRFALWCCRAVWEQAGVQPLASHLFCPLWMDDSVPAEREAGINWSWVWQPGVPHWFFSDLGWSRGMELAKERCIRMGIPWKEWSLRAVRFEGKGYFEKFQNGEMPPHTGDK